MKKRKLVFTSIKILLPLLFGGAILWWMYRDFDFNNICDYLSDDVKWGWMLLSFPFGIMAQVLRGLRWKQPLVVTNEHPRTAICLCAVFLSYASSLVVPRIGEFTRCVVLKRYDGIPFAKSLGTVVTERILDSVVVLLVTLIALFLHTHTFITFFSETGTSLDNFLNRFTLTGFIVSIVCFLTVLLLLYILLRRLSLYDKAKSTFEEMLYGILSLKKIKNPPLFIVYTLGIWLCYFLHYYLAFFCFDFTTDLNMTCALTSFVVGSIAIVVPTPNGAGPWHFAVKTMLILYGVEQIDALRFVLIVHTVQTLLVILLGIGAWMALIFIKRAKKELCA